MLVIVDVTKLVQIDCLDCCSYKYSKYLLSLCINALRCQATVERIKPQLLHFVF